MAKKTYTCTRRVEHDGKPHEEHEQISLEDEHAKPLLACGAIVEPKKSKAPKGDDDNKGGTGGDAGGGSGS
jgi:hypothetical protein